MRDLRAVRWLYHLRVRSESASSSSSPSTSHPAGGSRVYAPASLAREGFVHFSFAPAVRESARLYLPPDAPVEVLRVDPRRLRCRVEYARTPRGVMPHVCGAVALRGVHSVCELGAFDASVDAVRGGWVAGYRGR